VELGRQDGESGVGRDGRNGDRARSRRARR
jgi:hypothetical protein